MVLMSETLLYVYINMYMVLFGVFFCAQFLNSCLHDLKASHFWVCNALHVKSLECRHSMYDIPVEIVDRNEVF